MGCEMIGFQIMGDIQEALVNAVNMNVFGADIFSINPENLCADLLVILHAGRSHDIGQL